MNSFPKPIALLRQLVATPSVSSTTPALDQGNRAVIDLLAEYCAALGFKTELMPLDNAGRKANLIATLGRGPGGLVLAGHTDTVPFDEGRWSCDPLSITERDGRLYGLGSTDMKGFFPLALAAAREVIAGSGAGMKWKQPLIILATADEESTMQGARALAAAGRPLGRRAIIGEPTGLAPVRLHKGIMMERIRIAGRSGHSSDPALGENALNGLHAVLGELIRYRDDLQSRCRCPALAVPHPTLNLGRVAGGDNPNRICGAAELHFDVRITPGMSNEEARADIRSRLQALSERAEGLEFAMDSLFTGVEPFEEAPDSPLVQLAERLTGHPAEAVAFATEAPYFKSLGMEVIVLGPGSIRQAHQPNEYIELNQFQPCIDLLKGFIRECCM